MAKPYDVERTYKRAHNWARSYGYSDLTEMSHEWGMTVAELRSVHRRGHLGAK